MTLFDDDIENCLRTLAQRLREITDREEFVVTFSDDLRETLLVVGEDLESFPVEDEAIDAINDTVEEIAEIADRRGKDAPTSYWLQSRGSVEYRLTYGTRESGSITLP